MHDVATNLLSETLTKCLAVFETCFQCGISLQMKWIPHSLNDKVDYVSRIIDFYDWQLNPQIFCQLDGVWGPHTIDQFASPYNAQLPRYNSWYWDPGCEAVDAFSMSWAWEVSWLVPPLHLICHIFQTILKHSIPTFTNRYHHNPFEAMTIDKS